MLAVGARRVHGRRHRWRGGVGRGWADQSTEEGAIVDQLHVGAAEERPVDLLQGRDGVLEAVIRAGGHEQLVVCEDEPEERVAGGGVAAESLEDAGHRRRPVTTVVVDLARRAPVGADVGAVELVGAVDPAQAAAAVGRRGERVVGDRVPIADAVAARRLVGRVAVVEVVHRREQVAEALADRPLLRIAAGPEPRHLVVLDGVPVLVGDDVGVLGVVDPAVAEVEAAVERRVEGVVVREVVDVDRDRPVVHIAEPECLDLRLDPGDRRVDARFLEAVVGTREVVVARGRVCRRRGCTEGCCR